MSTGHDAVMTPTTEQASGHTDPGHHPHADLIDDYLAHLAEIDRADTTIRTYQHILRLAHRELPYGLALATAAELRQFLARPQLRTPAARTTYLEALKSFAGWAVRTGHLNKDVTVHLRRPKMARRLPRPCTTEQLQTILAGTTGPDHVWTLAAAYLGARCVEISRLDTAHIGPESTTLHGKGAKTRVVPTHPLVARAVRALPSGLVAAGRGAHTISERLAKTYRRLGADVTAHQLRHWYGTTLVAEGADIEEVRDLMGHANLSTTLGYVLVASPKLRAAVGRLPVLTTDGVAAPPPPAVA